MAAMRRHILVGAVAATLLIAAYAVTIGLVQDWGHVWQQASGLWYWLLALAGGFGVQAGLFSFIRQRVKERRVMSTASVTASGSLSAGSMAACCAHHLAEVLPFLGLSGAAIFLAQYQLPFIIAGVLSNIVGIIIMLETIQRHRLSDRLTRLKWNLNQVRKGATVSAVLVLAATFFLVSR
ncbi:MAG: hypothetical protein IBX68_11520 [Dehalococcoidia bacterium]|nr:hypothetical protein [Dehalococcoidia bacterium]